MDHFLLHFGILRRSGRPAIKVLFVLWLMSISMSAVASHVSSAEISYKAHPSIADRYIVRLVVFTDCGANIDPETSYDIIYRAGACLPGGTAIALRKGQPIDVSPSCNANGSTCSGGTGPGIFRTVYEAQVTLPTPCLDWRFSWEVCNRSGNISTVQNPQTTRIFKEARLNSILASGNTSPQFGNDWTFGDSDTSSLTHPIHLYGQAGTFPTRLIVTDSNACTDTATVNILVRKLPKAGFDAVGEPFYALEPVMFLDRADSTVIEWNWLFGDGDSLITDLSQDPFHTYMTIDSFTVLQVVTDAFGCRDTARKLIDMNIYVALPNAFSPNGDGRNDLFHLLYPRERKDALALDAFRVYNRYGETVFDAQGDMESGWDGSFNGKMQEPGVFLYFAKLQTRYQEEIILKGQVTLLK